MDERQNNTRVLDRYLSPLDVWAIAFGVMVGWGVFAMPGNTFLPVAGPAGTLIAMGIGMVIMLVAGNNLVTEWNTEAGRFWSTVTDLRLMFPFILAAVIAVIGIIVMVIGLIKKED